MFISFNKFKRNELTVSQKEFLHVLVPFARLVQEYTITKCNLAGINSKQGINAAIIAAEAIIKSDWNTHKIAKKYNNLLLIEADDFWYGKDKELEGKFYRTYDSWLELAIDCSDYFVFSDRYKEVLLSKNLDDQIDNFSKLDLNPTAYCSKIEELLRNLGLWEFNIPPQR